MKKAAFKKVASDGDCLGVSPYCWNVMKIARCIETKDCTLCVLQG
jgi:hypothetical protein